MMKFALHIIAGADFGYSFEWEEAQEDIWTGHKTSFRHAIDDTLTYLFAITFLPKKIKTLPISILRKVDEAYEEFGSYLRDLLQREKRLSQESDRENLLSVLVKNATSTTEDGDLQGSLSDQEVIGNAFLFLMAGHDTRYTGREDADAVVILSLISSSCSPCIPTFKKRSIAKSSKQSAKETQPTTTFRISFTRSASCSRLYGYSRLSY